MFCFDRVRAQRILLTLVGTFLAIPALGQPPRPAIPTDIAGEWDLWNNEEDTTAQPPLGDYTGIPFNDAGRMRSDTTAESIWGTPEYLCRPHSAPHQWRGLGGSRILKEQDPLTRDIDTFHVQFMRSLDRPIFMDGRAHPPPWAPHSWTGFSTGEWIGNTLKVTTTHLKDGYLRRGGPQTSDMYTMTEFLTRHGDILTIVTAIDDPVYLEEPLVHSTTYMVDTVSTVATETCSGSAFVENGGTDRHWVPHFLPGENTVWTEWIADGWVPEAAVRGGVETLYPEYRSVLDGSVDAAALDIPNSRSAFSPGEKIAAQSPRDGEVHVLPVQGNVFMLVADGTNIAASIGEDGVLVVNTGSAPMSDAVLETLNQLANAVVSSPDANNCFGARCPGTWGWSSPYVNAVISSPTPAEPVRYIINTSGSPDHIGGNERLATAGFLPGDFDPGQARPANTSRVDIIAHENVAFRMSDMDPPPSGDAWPTETYFDEFHKLPAYFNGEGVVIYHEPRANTDGDSIVFFRQSEVISAGDIFSTVSYPVIDLERGGSVEGVIDGLNHILDLSFAEYRAQGGTWIVPGRGRLSDTADVASYRNMVSIIRDRVQDMIDRGLTLAEVQAARPTLDFDPRYGSTTGPWTTAMFVESVYRSLTP